MDIYSIDERLNCIRLSWSRDGKACHGLEAGNMFGLVSIDSIRVICHIVCMNSALKNLAAHNNCVQEVQNNLGDGNGWATDWFYLNRFLVTPGVQFTVEEREQ